MIGGQVDIWEKDSNGLYVGYSEDVKSMASECCERIQTMENTDGITYQSNAGLCLIDDL